jgi:sulfate transport system ATP-binding protein
MSIDIRQLHKTFGRFRALEGVTLHVPDGELVALLGPSGCGKTTLLRIIAGLEQPDGGEVIFGGQDELSHQRKDARVGFVFQHYALFRHMNVFENVAFGMRVRPRSVRPSKDEIAERVNELLRLVQLDGFAQHQPQQLSGGQRQRVALARALAVQPRILLLDEPFGALDARVRVELRRWLRRLHDDIQLTSVFVTHDQEEALEVADRVVVMNRGRVEQIGTPDEVFHHPRNEFVLDFLGSVNQFHGRVVEGRAWFGEVAVDCPPGLRDAAAVRLFFRPHEIELSTEPVAGPSFAATVAKINSAGATVRLELETDSGERIDAEISRERFAAMLVGKGSRVFVIPREARLFAEESLQD